MPTINKEAFLALALNAFHNALPSDLQSTMRVEPIRVLTAGRGDGEHLGFTAEVAGLKARPQLTVDLKLVELPGREKADRMVLGKARAQVSMASAYHDPNEAQILGRVLVALGVAGEAIEEAMNGLYVEF